MKWSFLIVAVIFLVIGIVMIVQGINFTPTYSGERVLNTETDYTQLRQAIISGVGNKTIESWQLSIVTLEPPITMKFSVVSNSFPYGSRNNSGESILIGVGGFVVGLGASLGIAGGIAGMKRKSLPKE